MRVGVCGGGGDVRFSVDCLRDRRPDWLGIHYTPGGKQTTDFTVFDTHTQYCSFLEKIAWQTSAGSHCRAES